MVAHSSSLAPSHSASMNAELGSSRTETIITDLIEKINSEAIWFSVFCCLVNGCSKGFIPIF